MSPVTCPTCGTAHGPERRYCLTCGALVGQRPVEPVRAPAPVRTAVPTAAATTSASYAADGLWRRPATSILTVVALATGVAAGFLLDPQDGAALGPGSAAAAQSGGPVAAATTPAALAADGGPTGGAAPSATPAATGAAPDVPGDAADPASGTPGAAVPTATPQLADATAALPADGAAPAPADAAGPSATPPASPASPDTADANAADDGKDAKGKTASTPKSAKDGAGAQAASTPAKRAGDAAGLPRIDHVWVVGIGTPVAARDGGYLGETLLAAATELPKYTPGATDPVAGAAALVAGRGPSASATTIAGQLTAAKRRWRAYAPGSPSCSDAPASNPFLAFGTVTSAPDCADGIAGLDALPADLRSADATPAFSYVATDPTLDAGGLDAQLRQVVEPIRRSAAFKRSGLIAIVPTAAPAAATTGALILSPFAAGSTAIGTAFGPYSLLRTFADLLGLERLGHAADSGVRGLGPEVLTPED